MNPLLLRLLALAGVGGLGTAGWNALPPAPIQAAQQCEREGGISLRWYQAAAGQPYQATMYMNYTPVPETFTVKAGTPAEALQRVADTYCDAGGGMVTAAPRNIEAARAVARSMRIALD